MVTVALNPDEARRLREILESYLGELRMEISATETLAMREDLKRTKDFLEDLLTRLDVREMA